jgi:hypothetical protein
LSKRKRRTRSSSKPVQRRQKSPSLLIPVVIGLVVVAVIVGAVLSVENRRSGTGDVSGGALVATSGPLPTLSPPNPSVNRVSIPEANERVQSGEAVLVDVRSRASYDKAHATGAMSVPEEEVDARLDDLPRDKDLILYCT